MPSALYIHTYLSPSISLYLSISPSPSQPLYLSLSPSLSPPLSLSLSLCSWLCLPLSMCLALTLLIRSSKPQSLTWMVMSSWHEKSCWRYAIETKVIESDPGLNLWGVYQAQNPQTSPSNPPRPPLLRGRFGIDSTSISWFDPISISNRCDVESMPNRPLRRGAVPDKLLTSLIIEVVVHTKIVLSIKITYFGISDNHVLPFLVLLEFLVFFPLRGFPCLFECLPFLFQGF